MRKICFNARDDASKRVRGLKCGLIPRLYPNCAFEQRRLWRACAFAQSRMSPRSLAEPSLLDYVISTKISCAGSYASF